MPTHPRPADAPPHDPGGDFQQSESGMLAIVLRSHFGRLNLLSWGSLLAGLVLVGVLWGRLPLIQWVTWGGLHGAVLTALLLVRAQVRREAARELKAQLWGKVLVACALATGLVWGSAFVMLLPTSGGLLPADGTVLMGAVAVGGVAAFGGMPIASATFVLSAVMPSAFYTADDPSLWEWRSAAELALFAAILSALAALLHGLSVAQARMVLRVRALQMEVERLGRNNSAQAAAGESDPDAAEVASPEGAEVAGRADWLRTLVDQAADAVSIHDRDGRVIDVNDSVCRLLGYSRSELLSLSAEDIVVDYARHAFSQYRDVLHGGESVTLQGQYRCRDGTSVPVEIHCGRIRYRGRAYMMAMARDVTRRIVTESRLRQEQKMEALGRLTKGVAHEFNNLLAVIMGNTELLMRRLGVEAPPRELEHIMRASERGAQLTHNLQGFARSQTLDVGRTDVNERIDRLRFVIEQALGTEIKVEFRQQPEVWPVKTDGGQLDSALLNLAFNARDAMAQGGQLVIVSMNVTVAAGDPNITEDLAPGDYVRITVSDSGHGMSEDTLQKAFEPFFTTKEVGRGTGLGLSTVYGFAQQSSGLAHISSNSEVGTSISLYLPRLHDSAAPESPARQSGFPALGLASAMGAASAQFATTRRVLVVEDEANLRGVLVDSLEELDCVVAEAPDAQQALRLMEEQGPFNLLLTDVGLPGPMDGVEMARRAQVLQPGLKVVFSSGYPEDTLRGLAHGVCDFQLLGKPYRFSELQRLIGQLLS